MCHRPSFLAREICDPSDGVFSLKHSEFGFVDCSELSFKGDRRAYAPKHHYFELNYQGITENYAW